MPDIVCTCVYEKYIDTPMSIWTTILDFFFSTVIGVLAVMVNYSFMKKLEEEKRQKPPGRKGNVIEPVMHLFCKIQMVYWPYYLLYFWINFNGIIPSYLMNGWWCNVILQISIKFLRMLISWNSFFVALIRYIYIVHREKSNQWEFEQVGKWFKMASVCIPTFFNIIELFTKDHSEFKTGDTFERCISFYSESNVTGYTNIPKMIGLYAYMNGPNMNVKNTTIPNIYPYAWTIELLPEPIILVLYYITQVLVFGIGLNLAELFFYFKIFRCVKR